MSIYAPPTISLGYTQITGNITTTSGSAVAATGLSVSVTIPAGGRRIKITMYGNVYASVASYVDVSIWDGTVGSGTQLAVSNNRQNGATETKPCVVMAVVTPAAGSKTYNIGWNTTGGTATLQASATQPAFILVEAM